MFPVGRRIEVSAPDLNFAIPIESIDNRRLYRQIADQISRLIESGEYHAGERLPVERVLAEQLSVSRPTVREALIALKMEGRVDIRGGAGVFVLEPGVGPARTAAASEVPVPGPFEVLFARDLIEPDVAAQAARNATAGHLLAMSQALGDMVCCSASNPQRLDYDRCFHFSQAEASGNSALVLAIHAFWALREQPVYLRLEDHFHSEPVWQRAIIEHREIFEAVKRADAEGARAAMHRDLKIARMRFVSHWKKD